MKTRIINIDDGKSFIESGFIECKRCGWTLEKEEYKKHNCFAMRNFSGEGTKMPQNKK